MPRRRDRKPAMPSRRRPPRPRARLPPGERERRLAEEVLYLHSLWRRGPAAPARTQSRSAGRITTETKRRRLDTAADQPQDTGLEWPLAPSPPNSSPKTWPEAAPASSPSPAKPPPPPPSPGALAQREALRSAAEFFSNRDSDDDDDGAGSESEGEQDAAGFITGLFERDAALRGHYERGWEEGQFACVACAGGARKPGRRFRGCVALVQHARAATRYGRPRAHRALAAVVCRVLGWDVARLPSIVIDPRGTLGQALAAEAKADVQLAKENDATGDENDSSSDEDEEEEEIEKDNGNSSANGDEEDNELENSEDSAEKEDVEKGTEDSRNTEEEEEEDIELDNGEKSAEKEELEENGAWNSKEISKNEVLRNKLVQEVNTSKDDSLNQGNSEEVHRQEIAKESSEQENINNTYLPGSKDRCKK
ncbi:uncharacterized protein LOC120702655 isoform X3 [Panicum virgatum]|uniref:Uncharacterized protein n=1 Tax=Panicum virgatum TaxID=38727 RepID=A0A8T0TL35_PANVG|nr:uncharacterized protein LOC120702655 isoform X3 [Panicum virgatum]XP_039842468.1 uncharacterized protein LOC120702655 isoform X3 [Panicum virgatum]XP_039842469.1 uncharacterized protein LOC120702655 isoform X3 [Panicum virgatum]KAG2609474.1 hypothetical protein PVAP13_4KG045000 [Panicum virgatum]KAG2609475.1 hypothetical protein PVAP13_4KG045000 [Panicum virgatum]KAG2609476.1 hypothetical protein PVAP13_4KG045000 [Panicum virgatum]KAG2609477.1 hypothetical protein PVAP13_4KG045000 [Panicum